MRVVKLTKYILEYRLIYRFIEIEDFNDDIYLEKDYIFNSKPSDAWGGYMSAGIYVSYTSIITKISNITYIDKINISGSSGITGSVGVTGYTDNNGVTGNAGSNGIIKMVLNDYK